MAYFAVFNGPVATVDSAWAAFGDYMGGVTGPVLSLLALAALLITIRLQLEELRETRQELERSTRALKVQANAMSVQIFDNAFFAQLRLLGEIVAGMDIERVGNVVRGRDCFAHVVGELRKYALAHAQKGIPLEHPENYMDAYEKAYKRYGGDLGHYFRTLYNIVRFVDEKVPQETRTHIRLLRAQLSDAELTLLFYNCLSTRGENFKPFVEGYGLLDNLQDRDLLHPRHREAYGAGAFTTQPQEKV